MVQPTSEHTLNRFKFSSESLSKLKPSNTRYVVLDTSQEGLQLRVSPSGRKTYNYYGRISGGKPERIAIGPYPTMSLKHARDEASRIRLIHAEGKSASRQVKERAKSKITVAEAYAKCIKERKITNANTLRGYAVSLDRLHEWRDLPIKDITGIPLCLPSNTE